MPDHDVAQLRRHALAQRILRCGARLQQRLKVPARTRSLVEHHERGVQHERRDHHFTAQRRHEVVVHFNTPSGEHRVLETVDDLHVRECGTGEQVATQPVDGELTGDS